MIYVSFTTVPDRVIDGSMQICFNALLNQETDEEYKIVVSIPKYYINYGSFDVPEWLLTYISERSNKIILLRGDIDYGPITNVLYPVKFLNMEPEDLLIVCDDDQIYNPHMIDFHVKKNKQYPGRIIAAQGHEAYDVRWWIHNPIYGVPTIPAGTKLARFSQAPQMVPFVYDTYIKIPGHWYTVSYKSKYLWDTDMLFDPEFWARCHSNDSMMGYYAWVHDVHIISAVSEYEDNFRPFNDWGTGCIRFPLIQHISYPGNSGCARFREYTHGSDIKNEDAYWRDMADETKYNVVYDIDINTGEKRMATYWKY